MGVVIARHPKLVFVLPFKVLRLAVIETEGGISLFTHTWKAAGKLGNEDLYAGMIQGVNLILKESLDRGDVQEIKLARASLLAYRDARFPIVFVIVATKASRTLRDALRLFANRFLSDFKDNLATKNDVGQFDPANAIVAECFPFVPEYD
jgi:hypothetical protein